MYVCTKCGSKNVESLGWIDLNTGENGEDEVGEYFCRDCNTPCDVEYVNGDFDDDIADELEKELAQKDLKDEESNN